MSIVGLIKIMETIRIVVGANKDATFIVNRQQLAATGDYFKRLLDGSFTDVQDNTIYYADITPSTFQHFLVWLHVRSYRPSIVKEAFELYGLLQRFSMNDITLVEFISRMEYINIKELVPYVTKLAPEFDEDLINAVAKHVRWNDDLSGF